MLVVSPSILIQSVRTRATLDTARENNGFLNHRLQPLGALCIAHTEHFSKHQARNRMIVVCSMRALVPVGDRHSGRPAVEQSFTLLLRHDKIDRSIEYAAVGLRARAVSAGEEGHYCQTSNGRLTTFNRREGTIIALL